MLPRPFRPIAVVLGAATLAGLAVPVQAQQSEPKILFVLDASGSMVQKLADGQTRFDAARNALASLLDRLPPTQRVALRVYGHQSTPDQKNCEDSQRVVDFGGAGERAGVIRQSIARLSARGYTPISKSLELAAGDFAGESAGGRMIILISDGRETCKADPCAVARAMAAANASLVIHTVGFGVDDTARYQLQCVANAARGKYFDAKTAGELGDSLATATKTGAAAPHVQSAIAATVGKLRVVGQDEPSLGVTKSGSDEQIPPVEGGKTLDLAPGTYAVTMRTGVWGGIEIHAGRTTEISPAFLAIPKSESDALIEVIDQETREVLYYDALRNFGSSYDRVAVLPGRYVVRFLEQFEFAEPIEFKAGQTTTIGVGTVTLPELRDAESYVDITDTARSVTGYAVHGSTFSLPPGRYGFKRRGSTAPAVVVEVKAGAAMALDIPR